MSGGTSAGNIITEAAAVYAVRTWVDITKVDELGVIADAQLDAIIAANWFNNVDDNLIQVNAWMNGTGVAPYIRATEATIATVNATDVNTTNLDVTNLTVSSVDVAALVVGTGSLSDGVSTADDLVIGNLAATDRGITVLSTTVGRLCFADTAATLTGFVSYTHATDTLGLGVAGSTEVNLTSTTLAPAADGGLSLGTSALKYLEVHAGTVTAYTAITVGDGNGSPVVTLNRDTAGTNDIVLSAKGDAEWRLHHAATGGLNLDRYVGGVYTDSIEFSLGTGSVTLPGDLTVSGSTIDFNNASAALTIGSGANTSTVTLKGAPCTLNFSDGTDVRFYIESDADFTIARNALGVFQDSIVYDGSTGEVRVGSALTVGSASASGPTLALSKDTNGDAFASYYNEGGLRWAWHFDTSEDLSLRRYDGAASFQDIMTISSTNGSWTFPAGIGVSGTSSRFTAGTGAPSGGSNGDLYWRTAGTRSTCLYYRTAGVWEVLLT